MVEGKDDEIVLYVNSETGFASFRIVNGVNLWIAISDTDMEEGHRQPTIQHTIYFKISVRIPIHRLDLEVKP